MPLSRPGDEGGEAGRDDEYHPHTSPYQKKIWAEQRSQISGIINHKGGEPEAATQYKVQYTNRRSADAWIGAKGIDPVLVRSYVSRRAAARAQAAKDNERAAQDNANAAADARRRVKTAEEADLDELASLLPLRIIDARVVSTAPGPDNSFTLYAIEVHTTRGTHTRHRRFREFVAAHKDVSAALLEDALSHERSTRTLSPGPAQELPELGDLGDLAKNWSKNSAAVVKQRVSELNVWLEVAINEANAQFGAADRSERAHEVLWLFLCRSDDTPSPAAPTSQRGQGMAERAGSADDPLAEIQMESVQWDGRAASDYRAVPVPDDDDPIKRRKRRMSGAGTPTKSQSKWGYQGRAGSWSGYQARPAPSSGARARTSGSAPAAAAPGARASRGGGGRTSTRAPPPASGSDPILSRTTKKERILAYSLIGGQIFANYVPRLAVPFVVPFMVQEFGFTDMQRAYLLSAFTPGYVLTQIPGAPLTAALGAKETLALNNLGTVLVLVIMPAMARVGAAGVWLCFAIMGVMQGIFIAPQAAMTSNWVPTGAERPLGVFIIRLGGNLAKLAAALVTPLLCASRWGWRAVPAVYSAATLGYLALFWHFAQSAPPLAAGEVEQEEREREQRKQKEQGREESTGPWTAEIWKRPLKFLLPGTFHVQTLITRPTLATLCVQVAHMLCEFNIVLSWAPTYFHEVLGVPLSQLGIFGSLPVLVGIGSKSLIATWESRLLKRGVGQLMLRKLATVYGTAITAASLLIFSGTNSRYVASVAYCGIVLGNSFDYSGFLPNFIELAGHDPAGHFYAWLNTLGWAASFVAAELINRLATIGAGGSRRWQLVWLAPAAARLVATRVFWQWASVRPAQEHLDDPELLERMQLEQQAEQQAWKEMVD